MPVVDGKALALACWSAKTPVNIKVAKIYNRKRLPATDPWWEMHALAATTLV
jgi:hypothetical protein